jgi:PPM family protein phosphatase
MRLLFHQEGRTRSDLSHLRVPAGFMIRSYGVSDTGGVRQRNEDCFLADERLSLFVVADGMGGHAAGDVASRVAVESILGFIDRSQDNDDLSWPCGLDPALTVSGNRVRTAIHLAHRRVCEEAESHDWYAGMGTTVVCALIRDRHLAFGHVGDSRLYVYSRGVLERQTRDDTWAASLLGDAADRDDAAVAAHPLRNVLTNVLGAREPDIHVAERELADGEILLLCTDGVHSVVDTDTLVTLLSAGDDLCAIADSVVAAALQRGSRDNVTALVVRYAESDGHG